MNARKRDKHRRLGQSEAPDLNQLVDSNSELKPPGNTAEDTASVGPALCDCTSSTQCTQDSACRFTVITTTETNTTSPSGCTDNDRGNGNGGGSADSADTAVLPCEQTSRD